MNVLISASDLCSYSLIFFRFFEGQFVACSFSSVRFSQTRFFQKNVLCIRYQSNRNTITRKWQEHSTNNANMSKSSFRMRSRCQITVSFCSAVLLLLMLWQSSEASLSPLCLTCLDPAHTNNGTNTYKIATTQKRRTPAFGLVDCLNGWLRYASLLI